MRFVLSLVILMVGGGLIAKWMDQRDLHAWRHPNRLERDARIFDTVKEAQHDLEDRTEGR
jgi:hypothetical protein